MSNHHNQITSQNTLSDSDDQEALFAELENEEPDTAYTHQRIIEQLNSELASRKDIHGTYPGTASLTDGETSPPSAAAATKGDKIGGRSHTGEEASGVQTLHSDQSLLDASTKHKRCIVHFSHLDFPRCATMDRHIRRLAMAHAGDAQVRFLRIDPRDAPFVVEKLKIKVLPCVLGFVEGMVVERIVGFEGLGVGGFDADSEFRTSDLERRLVRVGVLLERRISMIDDDEEAEEEEEDLGSDEERNMGRKRTAIRGSRRTRNDDDDWD
ncbi:hypothetical protein KEM54_000441 [Ascosphaera aggregata]|nr:hypothetical protein KEM54_000441 [Ascosphaera aggregata]